MIVGLCGGSGSGKGTVTNFLSELGAFVIDTDKIYHNITSYMSPCLKALVDIFGDSIVNSDGSLNRRALSDLVFNGADSDYRRHMLNSVSHKFVLSEVRNIISQNSDNKKKRFRC